MKRILIATGFIFAMSNLVFSETLTYVLQPGSTITPHSGANPIGPTEALTGTFQWEYFDTGSSILGYNATSLYFESDSYTIALHTSPLNNVASSIHIDPPRTYFNEAVDVTGLQMSTGVVWGIGSYTGPTNSPTILYYETVNVIESLNGGPYRAKITLIANQVPEPATLSLLALGGLALLRKRK